MNATTAAEDATASRPDLHPTEHRGLRELYVRAQDLTRHHGRLAERLGTSAAAEVLARGASAGRRLTADLEIIVPSYGIDLAPAAHGVGAFVALVRNGVGDRFLERGQAMRVAATDLDALALLTGYLARVAEGRSDERLARFCADWRRELTAIGAAAEEVTIDMGDDPDRATDPIDDSLAARAGHRANYAFGAIGEWVDRRLPLRPNG
jgi:hypothetical protein